MRNVIEFSQKIYMFPIVYFRLMVIVYTCSDLVSKQAHVCVHHNVFFLCVGTFVFVNYLILLRGK